MRTKTTKKKTFPKTYKGLLNLFMLRPIHDKVELKNAIEVIDMLAGHELNQEQEDYLEALSILVEAYENEHHKVRAKSPIDVIKFLLDENGLNASDLGRILNCSRSLGSKLLKAERSLTAKHIKRLSERFSVNPALFIS